MKRSFRKIFYTWSYYGPEIGLCSCLFKYAYFTYPVVPEVTHAVMGRARRMVNGFMNDFWRGYAEEQAKDHHRISNKVAETTADDYIDYQTFQPFPIVQPFRRVGNHADNLPDNVPIRVEKINPLPVEKSNPLVANVVEMLKNLQPKKKVDDFVNKLARKFTGGRLTFRHGDNDNEIGDFAKPHHDDGAKVNKNTTLSSISNGNGDDPPPGEPRNSKISPDDFALFKRDASRDVNNGEGRNLAPPNLKPMQQHLTIDRAGFVYGAPQGLPTYNHLPPADYTYVKDGVHHHVHDLRKNKPHYPPSDSHSSKGGWLSADFEDTILEVMGLSDPGRSAAPSVLKCSKVYVFQKVLRIFQKLIFKFK